MERGTRIGDYEILDELGRGGMGRVYRVRNVLADRMEAMKVLLRAGSADEANRFLREIKVLAALSHPHIAVLRTALTVGDQVAMVMELVEGEPLSKRIRRGPVPVPEALAYTAQVLDALGYAHAQGVIHRDVKPANMMITSGGQLKLTDFGIARSSHEPALTATGTTTGSVAYMSPEQVNGDPVDARSDLYAAGISLYEMVTGQTPFRSHSEYLVMSAHVQEAPTPPIRLRADLPDALNGVIMRAIAKRPADRFQTAGEFRSALQMSMAAAGTLAHVAPSLDATRIAPRAGASGLPPQPSSGRAGSARAVAPFVYVGLGAFLVVVAAAGTGSYLRRAEAGAGPGGAWTSPSASQPRGAVPQQADPSDVSSRATIEPSSATADGRASPAREASIGASGAANAAGQAQALAAPAGTAAVDDRSAPGVPGASSPAPQASPASAGQDVPPPAGAPAPAGELADLEDTVGGLSVRAVSVHESLDLIRLQQARQGLGLRGDISTRQQSMQENLTRAADAIGRGDAGQARRYSDQAQRDLEALERFLGR
jgi:serine/threonine-protein kinase